MIAGGLRWGLAFFFVPALAIRYGVTFGHPAVAAAAGLLVAGAAAAAAVREAPGLPAGRLTLAAVVGAAAAYASVRLVTDAYYEAGLLRGLAAGFAAVVAVAGSSTGRSSSA
ncbi:hypothetical protein ACRB68_13070 [Actinomadura sp. RB68]|uniref:Uncharacterized protein n=1 Tax=Actinomadura macrotermitis TaxID=2585200 RepID=A0A7K0BQ13_9ACTN|nr:hypothetical protein [Actinomadura macrotermitis]